MNYRIKLDTVTEKYIVIDGNDKICGSYELESSAKRRIRDLKAKEAAKAPKLTHEDQGTGYDSGAAAHELQGRVETQVRGVSRQAGCYPHVSKRAYLR